MNSRFKFLFLTFLGIAFALNAQQIRVTNSTCTGANACLPANQAQLAIDPSTLTFDPNDGAAKRRFQAFWITGDGNYLQFSPEEDAASMATTYNYPKTGNFVALAYLTGKYTNRKPPARAVMQVPVTNMPESPQPTRFNGRLGKSGLGNTPVIDVFSNHAIRRKYLTTFVLSWPANVQASGVYLFFNGYQNHVTRVQSRLDNNLIRYSSVEIPSYFTGKMDASKIISTPVLSLRGGSIPGLSFTDDYINALNGKYHDVLYFPKETATSADLPIGFSEKRYFPVLWTDSLALPVDTLLNFYVLITGETPVNDNSPSYVALDSMIRRLNANLSPFTPLATELSPLGQGQGKPQYITAVAEYQLPYLATFDPNQLTVENVQKTGADEYEIKFRLEMCNKGRGDVFHEKVDIEFSSDFWGFAPMDFVPDTPTMGTGQWSFGVNMTIPGVEPLPDGQHEESSCASISFKAKTNCAGLMSLWKGSPQSGVKSCVVFDGAMSAVPECHGVTRIDSTLYEENGRCYCCPEPFPKPVTGCNPGDPGLLAVILMLVLLSILLWWLFKRNS
jgi:hypothetical protein